MMTDVTDHEAYIAAASEAFRPTLERLRHLLREALPDAEEVVAYDMPGFAVDGRVVASYAAFSKQAGLYVLGPAISNHAGEIAAAGLKASKTGLTFAPGRPVPDDLVIRLAQASLAHAGD